MALTRLQGAVFEVLQAVVIVLFKGTKAFFERLGEAWVIELLLECGHRGLPACT